MNLTQNDKLATDLGKIASQIKVYEQSAERISFRFKGTLAQIYHLRRYLHLNHDIRVLVQSEALAEIDDTLRAIGETPLPQQAIIDNYKHPNEYAVQFILEPRQERQVSRPEYLNLFLEPEPKYENVGPEFTIPKAFDAIQVEKKDKEIDDLFA
jgi:hypothetical protein